MAIVVAVDISTLDHIRSGTGESRLTFERRARILIQEKNGEALEPFMWI
jgi:hypothetical protein